MPKCTYCGVAADTRDHVIPRSYLRTTGKPNWKRDLWVYACRQCNSTLGSLMYITVQDRAMYLLDRYRRKGTIVSAARIRHLARVAYSPNPPPEPRSAPPRKISTPTLARRPRRAQRPAEPKIRTTRLPPGWSRAWLFANDLGWLEIYTFNYYG